MALSLSLSLYEWMNEWMTAFKRNIKNWHGFIHKIRTNESFWGSLKDMDAREHSFYSSEHTTTIEKVNLKQQ